MSNTANISRADAMLVALAGASATMTKVSSTVVPQVPTWVANTFTSNAVTDDIIGAVETLAINSGVLEVAVSALQDAVISGTAKWRSAIFVSNASMTGIDFIGNAGSLKLLSGGNIVATVPYTIEEGTVDGVTGNSYDMVIFEYDKSATFDSIQFGGVSHNLMFRIADWDVGTLAWITNATTEYPATNETGYGQPAPTPIFNISNALLLSRAQTV